MVKRPSRGAQVWSMEKLENKLVDMREMYDEWRRRQQRDDIIEDVSIPRKNMHGIILLANCLGYPYILYIVGDRFCNYPQKLNDSDSSPV